jgi:hypothetical protein
MAHVNLETKKIYGCKKGSKTYYHELAHLKYEDTTYGRNMRIQQELSKDSLLMCVALGIIYPHYIIQALTLVLLSWTIFATTQEEIDCWKYANKKMREKNVWRKRR